MLNRKRVLLVAAHPDDEVLGAGGTLARLAAAGARTRVVFLGSGVGARGEADAGERGMRRECAERCAELLGVAELGFHDLPDNAFDSVPLLQVVRLVEAEKRAFGPDCVLTHHAGDLNIDHQRCCQAVLTAFRPQPGEACVEMLAFEVASATEWASPRASAPFLADTWVDIGPTLERKLEGYRCYSGELRADPHARSPEAVRLAAERRGREVGVHAAEAFMTLRRILR